MKVGLDYETQKFATGTKQNCQANVWDSSGQTMFRDTVINWNRREQDLLSIM